MNGARECLLLLCDAQLLSIPRDHSQCITPDQLSPSNWNQAEYPSLSPTFSSPVSLGYAAVLAVYPDTSPQYIQALGCRYHLGHVLLQLNSRAILSNIAFNPEDQAAIQCSCREVNTGAPQARRVHHWVGRSQSMGRVKLLNNLKCLLERAAGLFPCNRLPTVQECAEL